MGSVSSSHSTVNVCNSTLGFKTIDSLCIADTVKGYDKLMGDKCKKLGDEWIYDRNAPTTTCLSSRTTHVDESVFGIPGRTGSCRRVSFGADGINCCLKDLSFYDTSDPNPTLCFDGLQTCSPEHRSMSSGECQALMGSFCTTDNFDTMVDRWTVPDSRTGVNNKPPCIYTLDRALYGAGKHSVLDPINNGKVVSKQNELSRRADGTSDGFEKAKELVKGLFERFRGGGFNLGAPPGSNQFSSLEETLYHICENEPGVCSSALAESCSNVTVDELQINPQLRKFCGCNLQEAAYSRYTDAFGVPIECTPPCSVLGSIPRVKSNGRDISTCSQFGRGICIMDGININLGNTTSDRPLNFQEVCQSCGPTSSCTCFAVDQDITSINATTNLDIGNNCGSGITCYKTDPQTGKTTSIPCNTDVQKREDAVEKARGEGIINRNTIIGVVLVLVIVVVIVALFLIGGNDNHVVPTHTPKPNVVRTTIPRIAKEIRLSRIDWGGVGKIGKERL